MIIKIIYKNKKIIVVICECNDYRNKQGRLTRPSLCKKNKFKLLLEQFKILRSKLVKFMFWPLIKSFYLISVLLNKLHGSIRTNEIVVKKLVMRL